MHPLTLLQKTSQIPGSLVSVLVHVLPKSEREDPNLQNPSPKWDPRRWKSVPNDAMLNVDWKKQVWSFCKNVFILSMIYGFFSCKVTRKMYTSSCQGLHVCLFIPARLNSLVFMFFPVNILTCQVWQDLNQETKYCVSIVVGPLLFCL